MNKKDHEALEKFIDEYVLPMEEQRRFAAMSNEEKIHFISEKFFEGGAKHGRSQLNELRDDNMAELYDVIKKLQEENKKLVEALDDYKAKQVLKEMGEE
jgi:vacuolar-type H+-ATPase subunit I/STV1